MALASWKRIFAAATLIPLLAISGFIVTANPQALAISIAELGTFHPDVPENLPPGERHYSWPSMWALNVAATHPAPLFDGGITTEPAFYFPAWEIRCNGERVRTFPAPETSLLSYRGRACSRRIVWTDAERLGAIVSALALALLIAFAAGHPLLRRATAFRGRGEEVTP